MITLVLGGARSGKSALAERLAVQAGGDHVTYVATWVPSQRGDPAALAGERGASALAACAPQEGPAAETPWANGGTGTAPGPDHAAGGASASGAGIGDAAWPANAAGAGPGPGSGPDAQAETSGVGGTDLDMATRVAAHLARRPVSWGLIEVGAGTDESSGASLPTVLAGLETTALVDSLGAWVASTPDFDVDTAALCRALQGRRADTVVVSDEVGLGVHPPTEVGRRFRDALGALNEAVAAIADRVLLVVAGRALPLDRFEAVLARSHGDWQPRPPGGEPAASWTADGDGGA